jgi:hypothetical protein
VLPFWLRVVDADDRGPVAGAVMSLGDGDRKATTGLDGLAEFRCYQDGLSVADLKATGYGPAIVVLRPGHDSPETAQTVELSRSACLSVRVVDDRGRPVRGASVRMLTRGDALIVPPPGVGGGAAIYNQSVTYSEKTDEAGGARFRDLPSRVPLQVTVLKGGRLRLEPAEPLVLLPDEDRAVAYTLGGDASVSGIVVDEAGQPVSRCRMQLVSVARKSAFEAPNRQQIRAFTGRDGRFKVEGLKAGAWTISVAEGQEWFASPVRVDVPMSSDVVGVRLEARRPLSVRGIVLRPDGSPAKGVLLISHSGVKAGTDADGRFELHPLDAGEVAIVVVDTNHLGEGITVEAGSDDVVIRLQRGCVIAGQVVDAQTGEPAEGSVELVLGKSTMRTLRTAHDGTFSSGGLDPGSYTVIVRSPNDRIAFLGDVQLNTPGAEVLDVLIEVSPGGRLLLLHECGQLWRYSLHQGDREVERGSSRATPMLTPVLPVGPITVDLLGDEGEVALSRDAEVRPGETSAVDLDN